MSQKNTNYIRRLTNKIKHTNKYGEHTDRRRIKWCFIFDANSGEGKSNFQIFPEFFPLSHSSGYRVHYWQSLYFPLSTQSGTITNNASSQTHTHTNLRNTFVLSSRKLYPSSSVPEDNPLTVRSLATCVIQTLGWRVPSGGFRTLALRNCVPSYNILLLSHASLLRFFLLPKDFLTVFLHVYVFFLFEKALISRTREKYLIRWKNGH